MIIAAGCGQQVLFSGKSQQFLPEFNRILRIICLHSLQPEAFQAVEASAHLFADDHLLSVAEGRMRQYRNTAAIDDSLDRGFRL